MQIQGIALLSEKQEQEIKKDIIEALKTAAASGGVNQKWFEEGIALLRELEDRQVLRHMLENHQPQTHPTENGTTLVYVCPKDDQLEINADETT